MGSVATTKSQKPKAPPAKSLEPMESPTATPGQAFTPADLRPGNLLLPGFSRPGGSKEDEQDLDLIVDPEERKRLKAIRKQIDKNTQKLVNIAYSQMLANYAHVPPFGFFSEDDELSKIDKLLKNVRETAYVMNHFAREMKSPRRVRIEVFPIKWKHDDMRFRHRVGEMVAQKLLDLRNAYTASIMWKYRVQIQHAQNLDRVLMPGVQADLVREAIQSTIAQRKIMIAIYGDKCPSEWLDPITGRLKDSIKLDFTAIDNAIRHFCPAWEPNDSDVLPF